MAMLGSIRIKLKTWVVTFQEKELLKCLSGILVSVCEGDGVIEYECYHAVGQYSADGCDGCKYEMDCYKYFLKYVSIN